MTEHTHAPRASLSTHCYCYIRTPAEYFLLCKLTVSTCITRFLCDKNHNNNKNMAINKVSSWFSPAVQVLVGAGVAIKQLSLGSSAASVMR